MMRLGIKIKTLQPLLVGDRFGNEQLSFQSMQYIPGSTLRGALAQALLDALNESDAYFQQAFVHNHLGCSPLWPTTQQSFQQQPKDELCWGVVPFTAQSCKRYPSLRRDNPTPQEHPLHDHLLHHEFWKCNEVSETRPTCKGNTLADKPCDSPLKKYRTQAHFHTTGRVSKLNLKRQLITKTAVNAQLDSVAYQQLHSQKPLSEGQFFAGYVMGPNWEFLKRLTNITHLYLGMGRTRGFGKVEVVWQAMPDPYGGPLSQRLQWFNHTLKQANSKVPQSETWVTLNLTSPLLLRDTWGQDRFKLTAADLQVFDSSIDYGIEPIALETCWVGGWHGLLQLPRNQRQAVAPGSVWGVKLMGEKNRIDTMLHQLEQFGLGEGFHEGFGHLLVCHPFHSFYASMLHPKIPRVTVGEPSKPRPLSPSPQSTSQGQLRALMEDDSQIRIWRVLAQKLVSAGETDTQIRGLENLAQMAPGITFLVNQIQNQQSRVDSPEKQMWRGHLINAIYDCQSQMPYRGDRSLPECFNTNHCHSFVTYQNQLMTLIRSRFAVLVASALYLSIRKRESKQGSKQRSRAAKPKAKARRNKRERFNG